MGEMYILAGLASVLTSIAQLLLKLGVKKNRNPNILLSFINLSSISGYCILGVVVIMNLIAYRMIPFYFVVIFYSLSILLTFIFGIVLYKEALSKKKIFGLLLVTLGLIFFPLQRDREYEVSNTI